MRDLPTLNAIEDIRDLEARYARYADEKRWDDLAGLFAEDGWFRPLDVDGNEVAYMGSREAIATQLNTRNSGDVQPIHQLFTHEIEIESASTAKAVWAMADLIFRGDSAIPEQKPGDALPPFRTMRGWGHYHVTYRKVDGRWFIATRTQTRTRFEFTY
ncbi:nuclear transport factor 2 family protein [Micromonospora sp. CPCC 205539]|uniref:nuclear transport factor 2 family protein n=1 Tax=Micromonospora sp. CPCC 205539 TaxID=3122408 RepID=UPI002FEEFA87